MYVYITTSEEDSQSRCPKMLDGERQNLMVDRACQTDYTVLNGLKVAVVGDASGIQIGQVNNILNFSHRRQVDRQDSEISEAVASFRESISGSNEHISDNNERISGNNTETVCTNRVSGVIVSQNEDIKLHYRIKKGETTFINIGDCCNIVDIVINEKLANHLRTAGSFKMNYGDDLFSIIWSDDRQDQDTFSTQLKVEFLGQDERIDTSELEKELYRNIVGDEFQKLRDLVTELIYVYKAKLKHMRVGCIELNVSHKSQEEAQKFLDKQEAIKQLLYRTIVPKSTTIKLTACIRGSSQSQESNPGFDITTVLSDEQQPTEQMASDYSNVTEDSKLENAARDAKQEIEHMENITKTELEIEYMEQAKILKEANTQIAELKRQIRKMVDHSDDDAKQDDDDADVSEDILSEKEEFVKSEKIEDVVQHKSEEKEEFVKSEKIEDVVQHKSEKYEDELKSTKPLEYGIKGDIMEEHEDELESKLLEYGIKVDIMEGAGDAYEIGEFSANETAENKLSTFTKKDKLESNFKMNSSKSINKDKSMEKFTEVKELNRNIAVEVEDAPLSERYSTVAKPTKSISLRPYQHELCKRALEGQNVIICAPTGSGKTIVAIKIIKEHLSGNGVRKVGFLVNQVALAEQQRTLLKEYINCRIEMVTGETADKTPLGQLVMSNDILVMTAQILVDSIQEKAIEDVTSFSLLIFDECHHAKSHHPYNHIMHSYMELKLNPRVTSIKPVLPQIVGLTASLGVGKASHVNDAVDYILSLCANLDTSQICTARGYEADINQYVNIPVTNIQRCCDRQTDNFGDVVVEIMQKIEHKMTEVTSQLPDQEEIKLFQPYLKPPMNKSSLAYQQWLSSLRKGIALIDDAKSRKFLVTGHKLLEIFNSALIINHDCRSKDSLEHIEDEIAKSITPNQSKSFRDKLVTYFTEKREKLKRLSIDPLNVNPKLKKLEEMVIDGFTKNPESRAIIFVKTLSLVDKLIKWMQETPSLRTLDLHPEPFTGTRSSSDKGGMSRNRQKDALEYFKAGNTKLIIATAVAEEGLDIRKCNLVIRYDHVTNEVAMVQSRGRARAKDSQFVVVAGEESNSARKEELNLSRELLMNQAILELDRYDSIEYKTKISELQETARQSRDLQRRRTQGRLLTDSEFEVRCFQCTRLAFYSTDVRTLKGSQFTIIDDKFHNLYTIKPHPSPGEFKTGFYKKGKINCKRCGYDWGIQIMFQDVEYPLIKIEHFVIEDSDGRKTTVKKWKNVPFAIQEIDEAEKASIQKASGNTSELESDDENDENDD